MKKLSEQKVTEIYQRLDDGESPAYIAQAMRLQRLQITALKRHREATEEAITAKAVRWAKMDDDALIQLYGETDDNGRKSIERILRLRGKSIGTTIVGTLGAVGAVVVDWL